MVGFLNTALGYAIILGALSMGYGDILSNAAGYAAGLGLGFVLNSRWTFKRAVGLRPGAALRYLITFLVAYSANLAIVIVARSMGVLDNPLVHLAAICVYSLLFYLGSVSFVFAASAANRRNECDHATLSKG